MPFPKTSVTWPSSSVPPVERAGAARVVYVDSGSTDGSVELARQMGALVTELDQLGFAVSSGSACTASRWTSGPRMRRA